MLHRLTVGIAGGLLVVTSLLHAGNWPEFRGPGQQGHSDETNLPLTWSETENIAWKVDLPGLGWSSPSIANGQLWLTTAVKPSEDPAVTLKAICLEPKSGKILQTIDVFHKDDPGKIHGKNSHASPTPVIEGDRVYLHFGRHGTACLTTNGEIVWKTGLEYEHRHGPGGSPVIYNDLLILACDGTDQQYVVALDKGTGKEVWKTARVEGRMAYSTPILVEFEGKMQLVSSGGEHFAAYDPETGKELWRFRYPGGFSNVPRPVAAQGLAFASSGYNETTVSAIRLDGTGDVTETHLAWKVKGPHRNSSPIIVGDDIYLMGDNGVASCLDLKTGEQHWQKRVGGDFSSSYLYADGKLYITNESGVTTVLKPGHEFEELAKNELPGRIFASPAPYDGAIFLRNETSLYRIENPK